MALTKPILKMPAMSKQERRDLSLEAGRTLTSQQAHQFRLRKIHRLAVERMLEDKTRKDGDGSNQ